MTVPERSDDPLGFQLTIDDVLVLEELIRCNDGLEDIDAITAVHLLRAYYMLHPELAGARRFGILSTVHA